MSALLTVVMMAGIGSLYAVDVITTEQARDYSIKTLILMGVFTLASMAIVLLGGPREKTDRSP